MINLTEAEELQLDEYLTELWLYIEDKSWPGCPFETYQKQVLQLRDKIRKQIEAENE